ncbi:MAG: hypothetical protein HGA38_01705 [Candidatus Moranbacteria bacterium]|nr:hypothetical protein [Candidatus Moranbacteria bacterium]
MRKQRFGFFRELLVHEHKVVLEVLAVGVMLTIAFNVFDYAFGYRYLDVSRQVRLNLESGPSSQQLGVMEARLREFNGNERNPVSIGIYDHSDGPHATKRDIKERLDNLRFSGPRGKTSLLFVVQDDYVIIKALGMANLSQEEMDGIARLQRKVREALDKADSSASFRYGDPTKAILAAILSDNVN